MEVYNLIAQEWDEYKQNPMPLVEPLLVYAGGKVVLDCGTGNGRHLPLLAKKFDKVFAVDSSKKLLEIAEKKYSTVHFQLADICALPFSENFFDTILCTAVLHHLTAEEAVVAFNELHRVLKPGGLLLGSVWNKHQRRFDNIEGNEADIGWKLKSGETCQRFVHFFEKEEVEKLAFGAGFEIVKSFYELNGIEYEKNGAGNLCFVARKM